MFRTTRTFRLATTAASLLALAPALLVAQSNQVAAWEQKMAEAEAQLRRGDPKKVHRSMHEVAGQMGETLGTDPAATRLLARATAWLALAEAGLDELEAARWDWTVATTLAPELARLDLSRYGDAGKRLSAQPAASPVTAEPATTPASRKKGRAIAYPLTRLMACPETPVEVSVTVGADGRPRAPRFEPLPDAILAWAALETLRTWSFEPATRDGRPVESTFTLRTDLNAKTCRDQLAVRRRFRDGVDIRVEGE